MVQDSAGYFWVFTREDQQGTAHRTSEPNAIDKWEPESMVITYGQEKHVGKGRRQRTGELYARRFDGEKRRGEPILLSQPGTIHNWYPNVNQDVRDGLCVLYSRSKDKEHLGVPLAVMVTIGRL